MHISKFNADRPTGCFYLLSTWYKREESQRRFSIFFGSATLAGAFGSLLATAIEKMDGVNGYRGWRWIFILEGIATCLFAIVAYFLIIDFPEDASWLDAAEAEFMKSRLPESRYVVNDSKTSAKDELRTFFENLNTYLAGLMYFGKHDSLDIDGVTDDQKGITIPAYGKISYPLPYSRL